MNSLKKIFLALMLLAGGLASLLFSSCATSGGKMASGISPSNPAYYNPDSREFESRWPFGPAGFR